MLRMSIIESKEVRGICRTLLKIYGRNLFVKIVKSLPLTIFAKVQMFHRALNTPLEAINGFNRFSVYNLHNHSRALSLFFSLSIFWSLYSQSYSLAVTLNLTHFHLLSAVLTLLSYSLVITQSLTCQRFYN